MSIFKGNPMYKFLKIAIAAAALTSSITPVFADTAAKPTIVLVHGAFADASSWNGVIARLEKDGYPVVAVANPLRSVKTDGDYVRRVVSSLNTSVVLVGHSYGGSVITEAAEPAHVKSLVYVAAFAPDAGETAADLSGKFPGGTLASALSAPVDLADGQKDLYIDQAKFHSQFAADVSAKDAALMAATQRPVTVAALNEKSSSAAWKTIPSYFVYGDADKNIPAKALGWMAERAHSKDTEVVKGASHVVMVSHPDQVAKLIEKAAK